jgi:TRAP-type C4-dicarboxylate transport system permease small subunit
MKQFLGLVGRLSRDMDKIAGFCIFGVMLLVVSNVFLRAAFRKPILGTYELVGYLTALGVSLSLANCALQQGHIALEFIVDKLPDVIRTGAQAVTHSIALVFWGLSAWNIAKYAQSMLASGVVSPTAQIPVYPFIFIVGVGLLGLCLVSLADLTESVGKILANTTVPMTFSSPKFSEYARKVAR